MCLQETIAWPIRNVPYDDMMQKHDNTLVLLLIFRGIHLKVFEDLSSFDV